MISRFKKFFVVIISLFLAINLFAMAGCGNDEEKQINNYEINNYEANADKVVKSINHKGYHSAPENTLAAFRESAKRGFTMVECDVSFTKDGQAVLLHDDTVDRTSNGTGDIESMTFEEVRALDFGSWKSEDYIGEKIPSFDEFICLCRKLSLHPYIEIKDELTKEQTEMLTQTVSRYGMFDKVTWISCLKKCLKAILNEYSDARIGMIVYKVTENKIIDLLELGADKNNIFFDCHFSEVDDQTVTLCMRNHIPLEVWTVDSEEEILGLDPYISGVTSDKLIAWKVLSDSVYKADSQS